MGRVMIGIVWVIVGEVSGLCLGLDDYNYERGNMMGSVLSGIGNICWFLELN